MADQLRTYGDVSRVDDVLALIQYLTPVENTFIKTLGTVEAIDTVHSTQVDTLDTAASLAVAEGGDYTNSALTTPTRLINIVELIAKKYEVTRTQQQIAHVHNENELARQDKKAMQDWANGAEFDIVRSTLVSGVSGTKPKMNGLIVAISKSTNTTAHNSGTKWSASILKGLMKDNIDNSNGETATDIYMGSFLKDKTDDFVNKTGITEDGVGGRTILNVVDVFTTSLGNIATHFHRYVQQSTDATGRVLAVNPDKLKIAYLKRPFMDRDLARSGDYDAHAVMGKLTLEVRNQDSNFFASGFDID